MNRSRQCIHAPPNIPQSLQRTQRTPYFVTAPQSMLAWCAVPALIITPLHTTAALSNFRLCRELRPTYTCVELSARIPEYETLPLYTSLSREKLEPESEETCTR